MPRVFSSGVQVEVDPKAAGEVRLTLPAVAENVAVVRQALTGMTETLGIGPGVLADMKTAVAEACNNVVVHAYDERASERPVEVTAVAGGGGGFLTPRGEGPGGTPGGAR